MSSETVTLTKEEEIILEQVKEEFKKYNLDTTQEPREKAEATINALYEYDGNMPKDGLVYMWVKNPFQGAYLAAWHHKNPNKNMTKEELEQSYQDYLNKKLKDYKNISAEEARDQIASASYGSFESFWVSVYHGVKNVLKKEENKLINILVDIVKTNGVFWRFDKGVILCNKPLEIHVSKEEKLHNKKGPALVYPGAKLHFVDGEFKTSLLDIMIQDKIKRIEKINVE